MINNILNENITEEFFLLYQKQYNLMPKKSTYLFLKKLFTLEKLFNIPDIEQISINSNYEVVEDYEEEDNNKIEIYNDYKFLTIKKDSPFFKDYKTAFYNLQEIDHEIINYISSHIYLEKNIESSINMIKNSNEQFLNSVVINKDKRFSFYFDMAHIYFSQDFIPYYKDFLLKLEKGEEYQKTGSIYGVEIDFFPITKESFNKTYEVIKAKEIFLFNYSMKKISNFILENIINNNKQFVEIRLSQNDESIYFTKYDNNQDFIDNRHKDFNYSSTYINRIDFSKNINWKEHFSIIVELLYKNIIKNTFYNQVEFLEIKEKLKNLNYIQFENDIIQSDLKKNNLNKTIKKRI